VPNLWPCSDSEVEWTLAVDWDDALHLARAREQHALAYRIGVLRTEHKNSVADLALALGESRTLTLKLNGHTPATEDDLIGWGWLTGQKRKSYAPEDLWDHPFRLPVFPFSRGRVLP
jgi:hypothetical protein